MLVSGNNLVSQVQDSYQCILGPGNWSEGFKRTKTYFSIFLNPSPRHFLLKPEDVIWLAQENDKTMHVVIMNLKINLQ